MQSSQRLAILLDAKDNVATAVRNIAKGDKVSLDGEEVEVRQDIQFGHKFARRDIAAGEYVIKYGAIIGRARTNIAKGEHVHVHNVAEMADEIRKGRGG